MHACHAHLLCDFKTNALTHSLLHLSPCLLHADTSSGWAAVSLHVDAQLTGVRAQTWLRPSRSHCGCLAAGWPLRLAVCRPA